MDFEETLEHRTSINSIQILAVIAAGIGSVALLGWFIQIPKLSSFGADLIPMAPSTAVLFVIFGFAILVRSRRQPSRRALRVCSALGVVGASIVSLIFLLACNEIYLPFERLGFDFSGTVHGAPIGHMSAVTAFCFLLLSLSFLASLRGAAGWSWRTISALGLAGLLFGICFVFLLAYLFGTPLLYGGRFIPPALNTLLALTMVSMSLMILAWQPSGLHDRRRADVPEASLVMLLIFILLAGGIITIGTIYYRYSVQNHRQAMEAQLAAVAELKVGGLMQWRKERFWDAAVLLKNPVFFEWVRRFGEKPEDAEALKQLEAWMTRYSEDCHYNQVCLVDTNGDCRLEFPTNRVALSSVISQRIPEVLESRQVMFQDFYRNEHDQRVYFAVLVPIYDGFGNGRPLGALVLSVDPETYLYPYIKRWPTPSQTAETLLVRREGNDVVFLNELRFATNSMLNLREPLAQKEMTAVQAILGREGVVDGIDYRGVPVVAILRPVPDSPWTMVAHMDSSEVFAPMKERLWQVIVMIGVLLFGTGACMGLVWRRQRVLFYRDRAAVSESLRSSEGRFRSLLQNISSVAVQSYGMDGTTQYWNHASERLYGYTAQEAIGRNLLDLIIPPEMREDVKRAVQQMTQTGAPIPASELTLKRKDETQVTVFSSHAIVKIPGREPELFCIDIDLTERKRTEESHVRLATAVEQAAETVVITDAKGAILYANPAFEKTSGYSRKEALGENPRILKSGKHNAEFYQQMWATLSSGKVWNGRIANKRKDGSLYEEDACISPVLDTKGEIINFVAVKRDVTREVQLEQQFLQAQKMEAIGLLAGGVAHDFNNILSVILLNAAMLREDACATPASAEGINEIVLAAERGANLTRQMLAFSRHQMMQLRVLDLNDVVVGIIKMLQRLMGEDIALQTHLSSSDVLIWGDSGMIEQILLNLAVNARDAMPDGGQLFIELGNVLVDESTAGYHKEKSGEYVRLTVRDTGCGIAPEHLSHIFEPFYTTKVAGKGTGLGLATLHGIVEQHHGWVEIKSEIEKGTTFDIYLPSLPSAQRVTPELRPADKIGKGNETILVVEDELALRTLAVRILSQQGYRVLEAPNGVAALEMWSQHRNEVDLLLTDIIMPEGLSGGKLAEQLLHDKKGLKVIFMSGYPGKESGINLVLGGRIKFLQKPFIPLKLIQTVRECLSSATPI
jgi:PAS domain S-box-containing protein